LAPFESAHVRGVHKTVKRADTLASALGKAHDVFVLEQNIAAAETTVLRHSQSLSEELARHRVRLQKRALEGSRKMLRRTPGTFSRRFAVQRAGRTRYRIS
jgi:hypothetical protein